MGQVWRAGWDPTSRQTGYPTIRADNVAAVQGECFCFQLYGRCPYGDTVRRAGDQGCKYAHVDKHGKTVTTGVLTTVPSGALLCAHAARRKASTGASTATKVAALLRAAIVAVADQVMVVALEAAEQAALGVMVLVAGAPAQVEAEVVQLAEASVATADVGVGEACSEEGWRAPSPGRSRSRSLASAL
jgi:hypothetical protein